MTTLLDQLNAKLRDLQERELRDVLAFVESLQGPSDGTRRGSVDRILALAGSMSFDEGEFDEILADIQLSRELDLER